MHTVLTKILYIHAVSSTNHQKSYSRPTLCTTKSVWRVRRGVQILLDADKDIVMVYLVIMICKKAYSMILFPHWNWQFVVKQ